MRTIRQPKDVEAIVERLAKTPHPVTKSAIFPTYRDLVCVAAVLGFETGNKRSFDNNGAIDLVDGRIFSNDSESMDLLFLVALADSKDQQMLRADREDECIAIFEAYAAGGFKVLEDWLREKPEDPIGDSAILQALGKYGYLPKEANGSNEISF